MCNGKDRSRSTSVFAALSLLIGLFALPSAHAETTGTWTPIGGPAFGGGMTATRLADGSVIFIGGPRAPLVTLYFPDRPAANNFVPIFSPPGELGTPRVFHTATVLADGQIL